MKKLFFIAIFLLSIFVITSAQEIKQVVIDRTEYLEHYKPRNPFSLKRHSRSLQLKEVGDLKVAPEIEEESFMVIPEKYRRSGNSDVYVTPTKSHRVSVTVSNGQAQNYSEYPDGFLDARTLSMPLRLK